MSNLPLENKNLLRQEFVETIYKNPNNRIICLMWHHLGYVLREKLKFKKKGEVHERCELVRLYVFTHHEAVLVLVLDHHCPG